VLLINPGLITGFTIVLYLLAVAVAAWYLLGRGRVALSRAGMGHTQRRNIFPFVLFLLVSGLYLLPGIISELSLAGLSPLDEYKYTPSPPAFSVTRYLSIHAAIVFVLALLFTSVALLVTPRSWSKEKIGWILLLMGFIPDLLEPLLTMRLTDIWYPVDIGRLTMKFTAVGLALWVAALAMF
jgi:hypothetical protein